MITPNNYNMLKSDVIDFMIAKIKAKNIGGSMKMLLNNILHLQPSLERMIQYVPS
jgi:hypothetical protein